MFTEGFVNDKFPLSLIKKNKFMDTIIYTHNDELYNYLSKIGFKNNNKIKAKRMMRCFSGNIWYHLTPKPDNILNDFGKNIEEELIAFRGQLSTAINLAYTMKPTEIRLVGVDLTEEKSFFHDFQVSSTPG
jgi:hypothetical protein